MPDLTPPSTPDRHQHPLPGAELSGQYIPGQKQHRFPPTPETPSTTWKTLRASRSSSSVNVGPFLAHISEDERETDPDEPQSPASLTASLSAKFLSSIFKVFNVANRQTRREREALSTSRVDNLISLIRDIDNGKLQKGRREVITKKILPGDYRALLARLRISNSDISGFFHEALRYEYRPSLTGRTQFTIRMNSPFHESMIADINKCVILWLDRILQNTLGEYTSKTLEIVRCIDSKGGRVLKVGEKYLRADCSYKYRRTSISQPSLVIEVAWSQSTKKLRTKAREFIQESGGDIRTVVGFDFSGTHDTWDKIRQEWDRTGTLQPGPACVFVWRAVFDRKTGKISLDDEGQPKILENTHMFCDEHGETNIDERVCLRLQDMIPERVLREDNIDRRGLRGVELVIDPTTLMHYIDKGLEDQKAFDDETQPERDLEEAEINAKKEKTSAQRRAKQEKELEGVPSIRNWVKKHTYKLRLTEARQRRMGSPG
ncbi:hypothetical protein F5Y01DRAFT_298020 [Xylaria sp. FL0043]|nr:hypothetical protein F5Y01DRAFT_298020 [Xylaria sp. FL0043]